MVKLLKKFFRIAVKNYFISLFVLAGCFVVLVVSYKLLFTKPIFVYAKVKVGQGLWWASTQKPSAWFVEAIRKAKEEKDLTGKPSVQILKVNYYPWWDSGQYDVYIDVKLKVSKAGSAGKYNFNRSAIGVGAPIDFEFNAVQFSGTIVKLSEKPFARRYVEKEVTMTKRSAFPWEYDSIKVGDVFNNGETNVLEVLDKQSIDTNWVSNDNFGNSSVEPRKYLTVKIKLKGKEINKQFVYGEDQIVIPGKNINIGTSNFIFSDFTVSAIN